MPKLSVGKRRQSVAGASKNNIPETSKVLPDEASKGVGVATA